MMPSLSLSSSFFGVDVNGGNSTPQNLTPKSRHWSSPSIRQTRTPFSSPTILVLYILLFSTIASGSETIVIANNPESSASVMGSVFSNSSEAEIGTNTSESETEKTYTHIDIDPRTQSEHTKKEAKDKADPKYHKRRRSLYSSSSSSTSSTSRSRSTYYDFVMGTSCSDNDICGKVIHNTTYKMDGSIDCTPVVVEQRNRQRRQFKQRRSKSKPTHYESETNRILNAIVVVDGPHAVLDCQGHSIQVKGDANVAFTALNREDPVDTQGSTSSQPSNVSNIPLVQLISGGTIHNCTLIQTSKILDASTMTALQIGHQNEEDSIYDDGSIISPSLPSCFSYGAGYLNILGPFATGIDVTIQPHPRQSRCHQDIHIHNSILQRVGKQGLSISASLDMDDDHANEDRSPSVHIDLQDVQIFLSEEEQVMPNGIILSLGERRRNERSNASYSTSSIEVVFDGIFIAGASSSELESSHGIGNVVSLDSPASVKSTGDSHEDTENAFERNLLSLLSDDRNQSPIFGGGIVVHGSAELTGDLSRIDSTRSIHQVVVMSNVTVLSMTHGLILDADSYVGGLSLINSQFSNNQMDGVKLVGGMQSIELDNLLVGGNGKNGIVISTPSLCHGTIDDLSISNVVASGNFGRGLYIGCLSSNDEYVSENDSMYYLERVYSCGNGQGGMVFDRIVHRHTEFGPGIVGDECHVVDMTEEPQRVTIQDSCAEYISSCHICSAQL